MASWRPWPWRRARPSAGADSELGEIFAAAPDPGLLPFAELLSRRLQADAGPDPDPAFRARLRAQLVPEARPTRGTRGRHPWRLGLGLGGGVAITVGVALVILQLASVPSRATPVSVSTPLRGQRAVAVTQTITLHFNQPMDEAAVDQGLKIAPAVTYQTDWTSSTTLVISPAHGLAPNQNYVVSISKQAALSQTGSTAAAAIVIPFGTSSPPTPPQGQPPALVSTTPIAMVQGTASLAYASDGALVVLAGSGLEAVSAGLSPSASPSAGPAVSQGLYWLDPSAQLVATGVSAPAISPDSQNVAFWSAQPNGLLDLEVVPSSGGTPHTLASSAETAPGLAWLNSSDLLYAADGHLWQVSLDGQASAVYSEVQLDPTGSFTLAPGGANLFTESAGTPTVYQLATSTSSPLTGLLGVPTWAASGSQLAYIATSGSSQVLELASASGGQPTAEFTAPAGETLTGPSLDPSGQYLTFTASTLGQASELEVLDLKSGAASALSTLSAPSDAVWSPQGDQVSVLSATSSTSATVETLLLSGTPTSSAADPAAGAALATASSLAQIQVNDPGNALSQIQQLLAAGVSLPPASLLPGRFDRFFVISTTPSATVPGSYMVDLHLVRDATANLHPAFLDEQVTVQASPSPVAITALTQGQLTPVPIGPLVVQASLAETAGGGATLTLTFNADLARGTIGDQSISLSSSGQAISGLQFSYSPLTRTVTVAVPRLASGAITLTVTAPLADVAGTVMQSPYQLVFPPPTNP